MDWWIWLAAGLALAVAELATPSGFFIIFFGLAALTVGVLDLLGLELNLPLQVLLFTGLSVAYLGLFCGRLRDRVQIPAAADVDSLVGGLAIVHDQLSPGVVGRVEVRGTMWTARNTSDVTLTRGQRARIAAIDDGLTLAVVPE